MRAEQCYEVMCVARNLRMIMLKNSINQSELSRAIDVPQPTISRILCQKSMPHVSTLIAISKEYNISIDDLVAYPKSEVVYGILFEGDDSKSKRGALLRIRTLMWFSSLFKSKKDKISEED